MEKTDLVNLLRPERPVRKMNNGDNSIVEGENENNGADGQQRDEKKKIDENIMYYSSLLIFACHCKVGVNEIITFHLATPTS